jgi:hypothetical protein
MNKRSKTRVISIPFKFREFDFGADIRAKLIDLDLRLSDVDTLCDIGSGTTGKYANSEEDNMKMQSFLKICNGLDLDPRKYFELAV